MRKPRWFSRHAQAERRGGYRLGKGALAMMKKFALLSLLAVVWLVTSAQTLDGLLEQAENKLIKLLALTGQLPKAQGGIAERINGGLTQLLANPMPVPQQPSEWCVFRWLTARQRFKKQLTLPPMALLSPPMPANLFWLLRSVSISRFTFAVAANSKRIYAQSKHRSRRQQWHYSYG